MNNKDKIAVQSSKLGEGIAADPEVDMPYFWGHLCDVAISVKKGQIPYIRVLIAGRAVVVNNDAAEVGDLAFRVIDQVTCHS